MKNVKPILAILLVFVVLVPLSQIGLANAQNGTIYIRADGSVEGTDTIQRNGYTYNFVSDINGSIIVERNNVVLDGAGYKLLGNGNENGITLRDIQNVTIKNFKLSSFNIGIVVMGSDDNTILDNIVMENFRGLDLTASENNTISGNHIAYNTDGIAIENVNNSIVENTITNNTNIGIFLYGAGYNNIIGNTIIDNNVGINIRTCMNNLITQNNVSHNHNAGISSFRSEKDVITNNSITDNGGNGIETESSMVSCIISENEILNNGLNGFQMDWASNTTITKNRIQNNTENGIRVYESRNNTISKNDIDDNKANGIYLQTYSFLNLIFLNNITSNSEIGINNNQYSSDNLIHHNNFIDNGNQSTTYTGETNSWGWDNGFPSGGNYWSDYNGTDSNEDGLGDTPYIINENNQDNYPLMEPFDINTNQEFSTIPEFPFWTPLLITLIAFLVVAVIYRRGLNKKNQRRGER